MICYKDMTFCSEYSVCGATDCRRKLNEKDDAWLKENDWMPVAFADMSVGCEKYKPKTTKQGENK